MPGMGRIEHSLGNQLRNIPELSDQELKYFKAVAKRYMFSWNL